jgi:hypothetical protein
MFANKVQIRLAISSFQTFQCQLREVFFLKVCILTNPKTKELRLYNPENFVNIIDIQQWNGYNRSTAGWCTDSE